ncbi:hypothetical protein RhiirA1_472497 [Rhizophagus irregularis]|uniref:Uncharacterized protein n=1 Tax=Rhizophagus irregularis TaxID=588596 RepID=A0A2N0R298_9GLOM|nr:hypothetical protein RhiirA1_472497 [Rhizophagus irregularis]
MSYRSVIFQNFTSPSKYYTKLRLNKFPDVSHSVYNELTEDIFLNHMFDEDDFALIHAFKEDNTLSKKKMATKEDYDIIHHIFTKCNLSVAEAADHRYKCSRYDIIYDINLIDQWYNKLLQAIERCKEVKCQSRRDKRSGRK